MAITVEEMSIGACSMAVPVVRSSDNAVAAAIGVVVATLKRDRQRLLGALQVAARGISRLTVTREASLEWAVALGHSGTHVDQILRVRMQSLAGLSACLPDQKARPRALDHDAQLETRHRDIPVQP